MRFSRSLSSARTAWVQARISHLNVQFFVPNSHQFEYTEKKTGLRLRALPKDEDLYSFHLRYMWNEKAKLRECYVEFDETRIPDIFKHALGDNTYVYSVAKIASTDHFNRTLVVTLGDGREYELRIPQPNAGLSFYTTAAEAATMNYVRDKIGIPVPQVLAYCPDASESEIGAEYIVMHRPRGVSLSSCWGSLSPRKKYSLVESLADIAVRLSCAKFSRYGALYHRRDMPQMLGPHVDEEYVVGPTVGRNWFDHRRGEVDCDRGPWSSAEEYHTAVANREMKCLHTFARAPRSGLEGIYFGPGGYHPTRAAKIATIQDCMKMLKYIIPSQYGLNSGIIWPRILDDGHIYVDKEDPSQITDIDSWQNVPIQPMSVAVNDPALIKYKGPRLERFTVPQRPANFDELELEAKEAARQLQISQFLWSLYQLSTHKGNDDLTTASRFRDSFEYSILSVLGEVFCDGEVLLQENLASLSQAENWKQIAGMDGNGNPLEECPLKYTTEERARFQAQKALWWRDVKRKDQIIQDMDIPDKWEGAVLPDGFDDIQGLLEVTKSKFLDREARCLDERQVWEKLWPFQDDDET